MADTKENIILQVGLDGGKVAKDLEEISRQISNVKKNQQDLNAQYKNGEITLSEYTAQTEALKDEQSWLQKEQKGLIATQKLLTQTTDTYGDSLNSERQKLADMQKAYDQLDAAMRKSEGGQAFLKAIKEQSDAVKGLEEETGRAQRNVGNYPKEITAVIPGFDKLTSVMKMAGVGFADLGTKASTALKGIGVGLKNLGKQALQLFANPIILAIAAVLAALKQLYEAFQRSESAQLAWQKAIAPFKAAWQGIQRVFDDIIKLLQNLGAAFGSNGKILRSYLRLVLLPLNAIVAALRIAFRTIQATVDAFTNTLKLGFEVMKNLVTNSPIVSFFQRVKNGVETVRKTITDFINSIKGLVNKIANSRLGKLLGLKEYATDLKEIIETNSDLIASNKEIAESEAKVAELTRKRLMEDADAQNEIAELRAKVAERDKYTAAERIAMLEQAGQKEEEIAKRALELAKAKYEAEKLKNSLTESNAEDLEREAQAYAEMVAAETSLFGKQKELNSQLSALRKEELSRIQKERDEKKKAEQEYQDFVKSTRKETADRLFDLEKDSTEKQIKQIQNQSAREVESLRAKLAQLRSVDESARKELQSLIEAIEKDTAKRIQNVRINANNAQLELERENALKRAKMGRKTALELAQIQVDVANDEYVRLQKLTDEEIEVIYGSFEKYQSALLDAEQNAINAREELVNAEYELKQKRFENEYNERLQQIDDEYALTELELERAKSKYDQLLALDDEQKARLYSNEEEYKAATIAAENEIVKASENAIKTRLKSIGALGSAFNELADMLGEFAGQSKGAATAQKAFALSGILLNQAQAISEGSLAIAKGVESAANIPFPANIPAIISVTAQIGSMIAGVMSSINQAKQIFTQASDAGNFAHGGTVEGTSYTGDKLIAHVNSGEGIYTGKQANNLLQEIANNPLRGGADMEAMTAAFTAAVAALPSPKMVYSEFNDFTQEVATYNELAAI